MSLYDKLFPPTKGRVITNSKNSYFDVDQNGDRILVGSYFKSESIEIKDMGRLAELRDVLTAVIDKEGVQS